MHRNLIEAFGPEVALETTAGTTPSLPKTRLGSRMNAASDGGFDDRRNGRVAR
jgi:hypothetical protein